MSSHKQEVGSGQRFEFGKNWSNFLQLLDDERIAEAEKSLRQMLEVEDLRGKRFLDIGSGSGLFSLAARRLGAFVRSFDYDPNSAACTAELKRRYFPDDKCWEVSEGSVLDEPFMASLGQHDIVYSWGVLHHTGQMWKAIENAAMRVAPGGKFFISIYNQQGTQTKLWTKIKRTYNRSSTPVRMALVLMVGAYFEILRIIARLARLQNPFRYKDWAARKKARGMNAWHDLIDWVGGYPFEVARPEEILDFCRKRGFNLTRMKTCGGGLGCNEYVFEKPA